MSSTLDFYNNKIDVAVAKAIGFRRWQFGDKWVKGLKLADLRFNNYIRKVIEDAPANSDTVKLDIDETPTQSVAELKQHYLPVSHWVSPEGKITAKVPKFVKDLNAMHIAESYLSSDEFAEYDRLLPLSGAQKCFNTALARAACWLRAKKIEY